MINLNRKLIQTIKINNCRIDLFDNGDVEFNQYYYVKDELVRRMVNRLLGLPSATRNKDFAFEKQINY